MPKSSIAEIFRLYFDDYATINKGSIPEEHFKVAHAIQNCRTEAMGGDLGHCDNPDCDNEIIMYHSCRNRHCPKCQAYASVQWVQQRIDELLPVPYFHVVFTIPAELNPFALRNKKFFYALFFRCMWETLQELAKDPRLLGGMMGVIAILHTWGQNLMDHPHIHCIIPGGVLSFDHTQWNPCSKDFLLPISVVQKLFKGKFLDGFKKAVTAGDIQFHGELDIFHDKNVYKKLINKLYAMTWVVNIQPPFAGPEVVIKYLGRYTHRVAISDSRIVDVTDGLVTYSYKDYADGDKEKLMTITAVEFIRRFLLHVIPSGFMRIRHYGFLSNRSQKTLLPICLNLLGQKPLKKKEKLAHWYEIIEELTGEDPRRCPKCHKGIIRVVAAIPRPDGVT